MKTPNHPKHTVWGAASILLSLGSNQLSFVEVLSNTSDKDKDKSSKKVTMDWPLKALLGISQAVDTSFHSLNRC